MPTCFSLTDFTHAPFIKPHSPSVGARLEISFFFLEICRNDNMLVREETIRISAFPIDTRKDKSLNIYVFMSLYVLQ